MQYASGLLLLLNNNNDDDDDMMMMMKTAFLSLIIGLEPFNFS